VIRVVEGVCDLFEENGIERVLFLGAIECDSEDVIALFVE
jgi:hypothetical protein